MSTKCVKCNENVTHREDTLECFICTILEHFYFAGYSEQNYKKMLNYTEIRFTCSNCNIPLANSLKTNTNKSVK